MKSYQPLLLTKLDIRVPAFHVRKLELHRHHAETSSLRAHAHSCAQCLCYLSGQGSQEVAGHPYPVHPGSMVFLPPRVEHAFRREADRRPICLAVDFDWRGAGRMKPRVEILPGSVLRELRHLLSRLGRLTSRHPEPHSLAASSLVLSILDALLFGMRGASPPPLAQKIAAVMRSHPHAPLREVANRSGYQQDYLNRRLRAESGLTLGQWRARLLQQRAQELLMRQQSVAGVAEELGFNDPNYFSRWFRRQTGQSPQQWRQALPAQASSQPPRRG